MTKEEKRAKCCLKNVFLQSTVVLKSPLIHSKGGIFLLFFHMKHWYSLFIHFGGEMHASIKPHELLKFSSTKIQSLVRRSKIYIYFFFNFHFFSLTKGFKMQLCCIAFLNGIDYQCVLLFFKKV